ncbi:hypothetical protein [Qipengyuania qiaonensis]|uniref:Pentapeptide repeat-containing protein n=1 Tax=Qipengyuania qiaonensis TaxID=2867240 RepID=A0ABS7J4I9_9SPHN|nr:hypothetical protein [Qipengyuania qiaonensis]MBX7480930.1 hypothetical protein [Qipengyuania qiaonensis]
MAAVLETRSDCSRCAALCCIAYPSDEMPGFAAAKAAGEPCPKLRADGLCTIYDSRAEEGFAGCIQFECFGAGQYVVQHLFGGRDWRDDPDLLAPMVDAFLAMRPVADLNFLAKRAIEIAEEEDVRATATSLAARLQHVARSLENIRDSAEMSAIERELRDLYRRIGA